MDDHARARESVVASLIEDLPGSEADWLAGHLAACEDCSAFGEELRRGVRALGLAGVTADPELVSVTKRRLHAREQELRSERALRLPLLAAGLLGLASSGAFVYGVARALPGLGLRIDMASPPVLAAGVALWFLPASLGALAALLLRPRTHVSHAMEVES